MGLYENAQPLPALSAGSEHPARPPRGQRSASPPYEAAAEAVRGQRSASPPLSSQGRLRGRKGTAQHLLAPQGRRRGRKGTAQRLPAPTRPPTRPPSFSHKKCRKSRTRDFPPRWALGRTRPNAQPARHEAAPKRPMSRKKPPRQIFSPHATLPTEGRAPVAWGENI